MIRFKKYVPLALLLTMAFLAACGVQPKIPGHEQEQKQAQAREFSYSLAQLPALTEAAIVYVYRPASLSNVLLSPPLKVDGEPVFDVKNDSFSQLKLAQGRHLFELALAERYSGTRQLQLDLESGQIYYLRISTQLTFQKNKPYIRRFDINLVSAETAQAELGPLKIDQKKTNQNRLLDNKQAKTEAEAGKSDADLPEEDEFSISKTRNPFSR